jgi:hypothetical protein
MVTTPGSFIQSSTDVLMMSPAQVKPVMTTATQKSFSHSLR